MDHQTLFANKIIPYSTLKFTIAQWRLKEEKIVFTNGCFDILHAGHIQLLAKAASLGTKLIIGLNSDASIMRLKGANRPINNLNDRERVLSAIHCIDAIITFEEDTPLNLIKKIKPDILVKGGDYKAEEIVGSKEVRQAGGKVVIIPLVEGKSTTNIANALKGK